MVDDTPLVDGYPMGMDTEPSDYQIRVIGLLLLLSALCLVGARYQAVATTRDTRAFPPPGQLVDVGGYRLHLHCMGTGNPTVILESGEANSGAVWAGN